MFGSTTQFANHTMRQIAGLCGTYMRGHPAYISLPAKEFQDVDEASIPSSFDAREHWSDCKVGIVPPIFSNDLGD